MFGEIGRWCNTPSASGSCFTGEKKTLRSTLYISLEKTDWYEVKLVGLKSQGFNGI